jgi:hypothetical protein
MIGMNGHHHARTPSCFAVADRLPYPNAVQPASLAVIAGAYVKSVQQCARPRVRSGCTRRAAGKESALDRSGAVLGAWGRGGRLVRPQPPRAGRVLRHR